MPGCNVRRFDPADKPAAMRAEDEARAAYLKTHPFKGVPKRVEIGRVTKAGTTDKPTGVLDV